MATRKVMDTARDLAQELSTRGLTIVSSSDADGNPTITFGTVATGNNAGSIRLKDITPIGVNSLGQAQTNYAQVLMQVVLEAAADPATTTGIANNVQLATMMNVLGQMAFHGSRIDVYLVADGSAPSIANLDSAGVLVLTFDINMSYRLMGQQ